MAKLTDKQKANLFDYLMSQASYVEPSWGYHNGSWEIIIYREGDNDTSRDFVKAVQQERRESK